jgi:hypothetical protein
LSSAIAALKSELDILTSRSAEQQDAVKQKLSDLSAQRDLVEKQYGDDVEDLQKKGTLVQDEMRTWRVPFDPDFGLTLDLFDDDLDVPEDYEGPFMPSKLGWELGTWGGGVTYR